MSTAEPEAAEQVNLARHGGGARGRSSGGVKRVAYASTIWVYSDCAPDEVDEETLLAPLSHLYTSTKLAGELYCKAYQELYGIDYTILRFGIPYRLRAREAAVIPAFVNKALAGDPLTLPATGCSHASSSTSRISPTASPPASTMPPSTASTTSPPTSRSRSSRSPRRSRI